jgi:hypothetical protein
VVPVRAGLACRAGAGRWLAVPAGVGFGDVEAECFEFGDEFAQAAVVVEPGAVVGELVVCSASFSVSVAASLAVSACATWKTPPAGAGRGLVFMVSAGCSF